MVSYVSDLDGDPVVDLVPPGAITIPVPHVTVAKDNATGCRRGSGCVYLRVGRVGGRKENVHIPLGWGWPQSVDVDVPEVCHRRQGFTAEPPLCLAEGSYPIPKRRGVRSLGLVFSYETGSVNDGEEGSEEAYPQVPPFCAIE